jgi:hypothetical protein
MRANLARRIPMSIRSGRMVMTVVTVLGGVTAFWGAEAVIHSAAAAPIITPAAPAPGRPLPGEGPATTSIAPVADPGTTTPNEQRKAAIKALDLRIKRLRDDYRSQADPLEAQLKSLREKLEADLKPLEGERRSLVREGETPDLQALDDQEAEQLAALIDREKVEVERVRQRSAEEKKEIQASFQKRRQELRAGRK